MPNDRFRKSMKKPMQGYWPGSLWIAIIGSVVGLFHGTREIIAHSYIEIGFYRNALLVVQKDANGWFLLSLLALALFLALIALGRRLPLIRRGSPGAFALGISMGLLIAIQIGYTINRIRFGSLWKQKERIAGFDIPKGFFSVEVWLLNIAIVLGSLAAAFLCYLLVKRLLFLPHLSAAKKPFRFLLVPAAFLVGLLLVGINAGSLVLSLSRTPTGPNIILISLDTLRSDHLGSYGYGKLTSPSMDRLVQESVLFENAYCQASWTLPSHASMFMSKYPGAYFPSNTESFLPAGEVLCQEILREEGYRTAGIVDHEYLTSKFGMDQGYDYLSIEKRRVHKIVPRTVRWLEKYSDDPFFLFVHIYDIHGPYAQAEKYKQMFQEREYTGSVSPSPRALRKFRTAVLRGEQPPYDIGDEDADYLIGLYDGGIRYTDDHLAELFSYLNDSGLGDNTVVVLVADHGEQFMEHGNVGHGGQYLNVIQVPFIVRLPGGEGAGRRINVPVGLIDLLPTLFELVGVESPVPLEGRSLAPLIQGSESSLPGFVFCGLGLDGQEVSIIDDRFHLIAPFGERGGMLYDHRVDPEEQVDLIAADIPRLDTLFNAMEEWVTRRNRQFEIESGKVNDPNELSPETIEGLRALGYVD